MLQTTTTIETAGDSVRVRRARCAKRRRNGMARMCMHVHKHHLLVNRGDTISALPDSERRLRPRPRPSEPTQPIDRRESAPSRRSSLIFLSIEQMFK